MKKNLTPFDVIVIGSGIAGLNFALRAAEQKKHVLVVTKKRLAEAGTNYAQGGIAAVLSQLDNFKKHVSDTLKAGAFHNNKKAVEYVVKNGPAAIYRLIELGVPFATKNGELLLTREGGHSERRIAFVSDYTGHAIEKTLVSNVKKNPHITLWENAFAADLLIKNRTCFGVRVLKGNTFKNVPAPVTVLATGGIGQIYEYTTNPEISTGDGFAMGHRAGCSFRDMEFVQFHPTALNLKGRPRFLISEAVRGEGAYLRNSKGERFMSRYSKLLELAPRDVVSRAIFEEEKRGTVYLDVRHKKRTYLKARFPKIYQTLKEFGLDMGKDLIPITPAAHYICGGIKVNLKGETGIAHLYAFGEVAGTGVQGANRLASNSLLEALVFSDRILDELKSRPRKMPKQIRMPDEHVKKPTASEHRKIATLQKAVQSIMWKNVGIIRTKKGLQEALRALSRISQEVQSLQANDTSLLELKNRAEVSILITKSALNRKKSLGCHFRLN